MKAITTFKQYSSAFRACKCTGFEMVSSALEKYGDQISVDDFILVAIVNAMQLRAGQTYNSAMLIPDVTSLMN